MLCLALALSVSSRPGVAAPPPLRLTDIRAERLVTAPNLLPNHSFEDVGADGVPNGWQWDARNTDARLSVDETIRHSGRRSVKITNGTPYGAHVYGMFWRPSAIRLTPGATYTYSAWVRSEAPGNVGLMTGASWQFRAYVQPTGKEWRRIWVTFTPGEADLDCIPRVSTESQTSGVWLDDLKLEAGDGPSPVGPSDDADMPAQCLPTKPEGEIETDGGFSCDFIVGTPRAISVAASAHLTGASPLTQRLELGPGAWRVSVDGVAVGATDQNRTLSLRLGQEDLRATMGVRFLSAKSGQLRLAKVRGRMPELRRLLQQVARSGQDASYPRVSMTVLENFIPYASEDLSRGEVRRALQQIGDLEAMAEKVRVELADARSGRTRLPSVPRYVATQRPAIDRGAFVGPSRWPDGRIERRPLFFNGFGHFAQVVTDMAKWPDYGCNIIQIEFGPNSVFPDPDTVSDGAVRNMRNVLDSAQRAGVAVCLLISPHYLPAWAYEKWPHLRKRREGFLAYCLHAPEGRDLLTRFVEIALKPLADHPALHSICLSNEPVNVEEPCEYASSLWADWLRQRHGDVATMNRRWGSTFASFADVPLPNPFGEKPAGSVWIDYVRFNQEFFAGWHRMLADAVHRAAPGLPVHAKAMTWTLVNDGEIARYGVDATLFGGFSQINGNDAANWYSFGQGEFAQSWVMNAMGHDLQRSVLDAPVFNSENHLIVDRDTRYVPAAHIRSALWQAAVHGQGASAIWVWERTFDPKSDFAGSIMHRPACAEAVGRVQHDLSRAAHEIVALQRAKPQVCLLHSTSGAVLDMGPHGDSLQKAYIALTFLGVRVGFVTERQLEAGIVPEAPVLIVPCARHLSDRAVATLWSYRGRLVRLGGSEVLSRDEWDAPRSDIPVLEELPYSYGPTGWKELRAALAPRIKTWGVAPVVEVLADGKEPAGIEWRTVETANGTLVNLCNQRQQSVEVTIRRKGLNVRGTDVLTSRAVARTTLQPLEVRLVRVADSAKRR